MTITDRLLRSVHRTTDPPWAPITERLLSYPAVSSISDTERCLGSARVTTICNCWQSVKCRTLRNRGSKPSSFTRIFGLWNSNQRWPMTPVSTCVMWPPTRLLFISSSSKCQVWFSSPETASFFLFFFAFSFLFWPRSNQIGSALVIVPMILSHVWNRRQVPQCRYVWSLTARKRRSIFRHSSLLFGGSIQRASECNRTVKKL